MTPHPTRAVEALRQHRSERLSPPKSILPDLVEQARSYIQCRYRIAENGCWEWTGALYSGGYGQATINRTGYTAHRVAYEVFKGSIPEGLVLDHLCRNRCCINPDHLDPVTNRENLMRGVGVTARAATVTRCPSGHEYTGDNTYYKRGWRYCRTCRNKQFRDYYARRKAAGNPTSQFRKGHQRVAEI